MEEERKPELPGVKYWVHLSPEMMWLWGSGMVIVKIYSLAHLAMSLFMYIYSIHILPDASFTSVKWIWHVLPLMASHHLMGCARHNKSNLGKKEHDMCL